MISVRNMVMKLSSSTHDNVVCKHIFPTLPCVQHHLFSRRPATVSRKADQRGGAESHGNIVVLVSKSFQGKVRGSPPPKKKNGPRRRHYFVLLSASVCLSTSDVIQRSFDSPHSPLNPSLLSSCRSWQPTLRRAPSKHVGMYGKYSFLECHWQSLPANKGTRGQSEASTELQTYLTAFSITHR